MGKYINGRNILAIDAFKTLSKHSDRTAEKSATQSTSEHSMPM